MLNNLKIIIVLILTIGAAGTLVNISAQTGANKVLVAAGGKSFKQIDADKLVEFYEWAFQTRFTNEQRAAFVKIKIDEFRGNPVEAEKGNSAVSSFLPKIVGKTATERERIRQAFSESFVTDLRAASTDAEAKLLLEIHDNANGGTAKNQTENSSDDNVSGTGDLSSFAGKWVWQNSGSGSWDKGSGAYLGGSGTRTTYEFAANGSVIYTGIMNTMMGGCSQQVFLKQTGRASISGNMMTIKWSPGTSTRDYSCDKAGNYTKTAPASTENFPVSFKTNSTGQRLFCMYSGSSKETCFSPAR